MPAHAVMSLSWKVVMLMRGCSNSLTSAEQYDCKHFK